MLNLIGLITFLSPPEEDKGEERKVQLHLLHKETDHFHVLALPGVTYTEGQEIPFIDYLSINPKNFTFGILQDVYLTSHQTKPGQYFLLQGEFGKLVIPFVAPEFPKKIISHLFRDDFSDQIDSLYETVSRLEQELNSIKTIVDSSEKYNSTVMERRTLRIIEEAEQRKNQFIQEIHQPIYNKIQELFGQEPNPSQRLSKTERKLKHLLLKEYL